MLLPELPIAFGLVAATAASALAARRLGIPYSIVLVLVGLLNLNGSLVKAGKKFSSI